MNFKVLLLNQNEVQSLNKHINENECTNEKLERYVHC